MKILGIGGSLRQGSYTTRALTIAMNKIESPLIETEILQLRDLQLPFCNGENHYEKYPDVAYFRQKVKESNAILIAAPEYHGSVSGVVKNALDLLEVEHVEGKVIGLIAICGGITNTGAINTLRIVCRWLHGFVIPEQIVIGEVEKAFDENGHLRDQLLEEKFKVMMERLTIFASHYPF